MDKAYHYGLRSGFNIIMMKEDHLENYGFGSAFGLNQILARLPSHQELEIFCLYLRENIHKSDIVRSLARGNIGQHFSPNQEI